MPHGIIVFHSLTKLSKALPEGFGTLVVRAIPLLLIRAVVALPFAVDYTTRCAESIKEEFEYSDVTEVDTLLVGRAGKG